MTLWSFSVGIGVFFFVHLTIARTAGDVAASEAKKRVDGVLRFCSETIAEALAADDRLQVELLAKAFERNGVEAFLVVDREGRSYYATAAQHVELVAKSPTPGGESLPEITQLAGKECLHAARAISFGGSHAGTIHVWLDRSDLEQNLRRANSPIFVIFSLGFAALLILWWSSLASVFGVLKRLSSAARKIGAGDLSTRVPVRGTDELAELGTAFNAMVDGIVQARQETIAKQLETIHAMINTVEAKDRYTAGHCLRVSGYAREIIAGQGVTSSQEAFIIQTAALLHDIGKLGIPDKVLLKEGALTGEEMEIIRTHVTVGEEILSHMGSMKEIALAIRHHHERWDGLGYPDGLRGEAIPFASRVIGVADALDAMMTNRPYRKAMTTAMAKQALCDGAGKQFDATVVKLAIEFLERKENAPLSEPDGVRASAPELQLQLA